MLMDNKKSDLACNQLNHLSKHLKIVMHVQGTVVKER